MQIDKFRRKMNLRQAKYKKDLLREHPDLDFGIIYLSDKEENENFDTVLPIVLKEDDDSPTKEADLFWFELKTDIMMPLLKNIDTIYMFDQNFRRAEEQIDMMWSYLFKTQCPKSDAATGDEIPLEDLLQKCLDKMSQMCEGGIWKMYTGYRIKNSYSVNSNDFINVAWKLGIETSGTTTVDLIENIPNILRKLKKEIDRKKSLLDYATGN